MRKDIKPSSVYVALFNRFQLRIPAECVLDCSAQGSCDESVAYWTPKIQSMNPDIKPESIRAELKEFGAWDDEELSDDPENWQRIVWTGSCQVSEESDPYIEDEGDEE